MITVSANSAGQAAPIVDKHAGEKLSILVDFSSRLQADQHEKIFKISNLNGDGAMMENSRCNGGQFVQLDLGVDVFPAGEPYIIRNITLSVDKVPDGSLSASVMVKVYP